MCQQAFIHTFQISGRVSWLGLILIANFVALCDSDKVNPGLSFPFKNDVQCAPYTLPPMDTSLDVVQCLDDIRASRTLRHPDQDKTTPEMILSYSYNLRTHYVTSRDGYITTVYRITGGPLSPPRRGKPAALLFHGGGAGSNSWIIQPGDRNLSFKLADAGYEVWLVNARGAKASLNHTRLNADRDLQYWDFNMETIAVNDLPLIVDLMLRETGTEKIFYVCHSMGCAIYLVALSEVPELNDKISAGALLGPGGYIGHSSNTLFRAITALVRRPLESTIFALFHGRLDHSTELSELLNISLENFCTPSAIRCGVCSNIMFSFYGFDAPQLNYTNFPNILAKLPDNLPLKVILHGLQFARACSFQKFDYGTEINLKRYSSPTPPVYDLKRITTPTYFFYGESDNLVTPLDVAKTRDAMRPETVRGFYKVDWPYFNHIDFLMATDADRLVYDKILRIFDEHRGYSKAKYKQVQYDYDF